MFSAAFRRPIQSAVAAGDAAAVPWYLAGGIVLANCVAAYQPKGAAGYAASKINLAHPGTNDAGDGTAYPTWAAGTGWTFTAASSQYLTTGIVTSGSHSALVQFNSLVDSGTRALCLLGGQTAWGDRLRLAVRVLTFSDVQYANGGATRAVAPRLLAGNLAVRPGQGYRNGVADGAALSAWANGSYSIALTIGTYNNNGTRQEFLDGVITACAVYSSLTAPQLLAVATAMAGL